MPVPVSVSGWKSEAGGGVEGAPTVMETSGPFAALAARKLEMEAEAAANPAAAAAAPAAPSAVQKPAAFDPNASEWGIAVNNLDWSYPGIDGSPIEGTEPLIKDMDLKLKPGSCCLLLGANGAGKTTLLKILGGKHMVPKGKVLIHGREAFYDTNLTTSGMLSYIGGNWQRDVAFAGYGVTLAGDFPVRIYPCLSIEKMKKKKKKLQSSESQSTPRRQAPVYSRCLARHHHDSELMPRDFCCHRRRARSRRCCFLFYRPHESKNETK